MPGPKQRNNWDSPRQDDCCDFAEERTDFTIGQQYEDEAATTIICKECKGDRFIIGQGHCLTVAKCPTCGWECVIHDG